MATHGCVTQNHFDDDDDLPLIFKRNGSTSKQNQLKPALKKPSSQRHDGSSGRPVSNARPSDRQNSNSSKGNMAMSMKVSVESSTAANSKIPMYQSKVSSERSLAEYDWEKKRSNKSLVESDEDSDDNIPSSSRMPAQRSDSSHVSKEKISFNHNSSPPGKPKVSTKKSADDSEDEKPLSSKLLKSGVGASNKTSHDSDDEKPLSARFQQPKVSSRKYADDSEDEKPLSSKLLKSGIGSSNKTSHDSDDEKPLSARFHQNGSSKRDRSNEQSLKSSVGLNKRPASDVNSSPQLSIKKLKISSSSPVAKVKLEPEVKKGPEVKKEPNVKKETEVKKEPNVKKEAEAKKEAKMDDDDHIPIAQRLKKSVSSDNRTSIKKSTKVVSSSMKKTAKKSKKMMKNSKYSKSMKVPPGSGGGQKWTTLVHNGVIFPPPYKPHGVKMLYNGQPIDLTPEQEEVATMFAVMKDTEYATKPKFIENFMNDWRAILGKSHVIKKFELCDFTPIYEWHQTEKEKKKHMSTEEKKALKEEKLKQEEKYMWAVVDGVKEKVGNFRVEPPGLFRGRGEHPKMGKLKRRILPSDITINIGKGAPIPECPISGERWKEIKHDNTVTWLAFWNDPINTKESKYVFLAASSSLKGQSDKEKYEKARLLKDYIYNIRATYTRDFTSKDATKRQIAVATYLIDKLALRAGNEKDDDAADTVGCCTLKVENVTLLPPNKLQFDFLGKDSIRYFNTVEVELPVYKAIAGFQTGKKEGDDLFDKLDTSKLNAHLKELMPGLTAKVFRTYNASITLDDMLNRETKEGNLPEKIVVYQHANKEVAIICNHQRTVSKSHGAQMSRLNEKMAELKSILEGLKVDLVRAKKGKPPLKDADGKMKKNLSPEAIEKKIAQTTLKIEKMELDMKIKEDLKTVALGTSKINYLDPRISVAWCKRHEVPIEKIFNKSLLAKFAWAMDVEPTFRF